MVLEHTHLSCSAPPLRTPLPAEVEIHSLLNSCIPSNNEDYKLDDGSVWSPGLCPVHQHLPGEESGGSSSGEGARPARFFKTEAQFIVQSIRMFSSRGILWSVSSSSRTAAVADDDEEGESSHVSPSLFSGWIGVCLPIKLGV